jgi:hypothetical protein
MAEVIVVGDDDEGIVDARTLWRPKYVAEKQARETVEAQTTQLLIQNDQLRTEAAIEKRARETAEAQTTQLLTQIVQLRTEAAREKRARETAEAHTTKLQTQIVQLRTEAAREKRARETAEAQTTQLQTQIVQLRTEAAREKRARETAEAQTTQLHISNDQLRTEAAREKRATETAEAQLQKLSNELESTKATVRELQSATDALREELTLAATAQGKQEKKGTAMAQRERLGPEVAIAAGTSTQLQKVRAVMMEVQAQVTAMDAVEAFTQASLDASRGKVQTPVSASGAAPRPCDGRKQRQCRIQNISPTRLSVGLSTCISEAERRRIGSGRESPCSCNEPNAGDQHAKCTGGACIQSRWPWQCCCCLSIPRGDNNWTASL